MKSAVVYYSFSGNNETLAKELRLRFGSDLVKIEEKKKRTGFTITLDLLFGRDAEIQKPAIFLSDYDILIFLAPVWDAQIATPLKSFLKMAREQIRNYAFITVCAGGSEQTERITDQLLRLVGRRPIAVTELTVKDLLPYDDLKGDDHWATAYRINPGDLSVFKKPIQNFVNTIFSYSVEHVNKDFAGTWGQPAWRY